jgi:hypothetical protein
MKILSPKIHGILDYVVVLVFLAAPVLFGMTGVPALLSYALAAVHLTLTLLTDFPMGALRVIPLPIHGWIELAVGPSLIAAPWLLAFSATARIFYAAAGVAILVTWRATDYRPNPR